MAGPASRACSWPAAGCREYAAGGGRDRPAFDWAEEGARAVDRTFLGDGTRWVVDFKTGSHEGTDVEGFLDAEVDRNRDQLVAYARMFRSLEPARPVRAGLYYPLLRAWREVEV